MTMPAIPSGLYSATADDEVDDEVDRAPASWQPRPLQAKNVRVSSRLTPLNGRLKENQNSASDDEVGRVRAERAALVDQARDRLGEHERERRRRDQQQEIWRMPVPISSRSAVDVAARRRSG